MSDNLLDSQPEDPKWFLDEGIPGMGERPEWLPEKFKTVADMSRSYNELEKKFGSVPDEYDLSNSVYLDPEQDSIKELLQVAKDKRVAKEVIDKMVDTFDRYIGQHDVNPEDEVKKLGENAGERLKTLNNWALKLIFQMIPTKP